MFLRKFTIASFQLALFLIVFETSSGAIGSLKIEEAGMERHMYIISGEELVLTCIVVKDGASENMRWILPSGERDMQAEQVQPQINSDGTYTHKKILRVQEFDESDNGQYKCEVVEQGIPENTQVEVRAVKEKKTMATYSYGDEEISLHCSLNLGNEAQLEEWLRGNSSIPTEEKESKEKYEILENGTLIVRKLDRDDAGEYIARYKFKNGNGKHDCVVTYLATPLILDMKKSVNRDEGDGVELECDVKGWPRAEITWLKGKVELTASERVRFTQHKGFDDAMLHIDDLEFDDEGTYTCRAHSDYFNETTEKSIKLRVKSKLAWLWPLIGIIAEVVVLGALIFIFGKLKKKED